MSLHSLFQDLCLASTWKWILACGIIIEFIRLTDRAVEGTFTIGKSSWHGVVKRIVSVAFALCVVTGITAGWWFMPSEYMLWYLIVAFIALPFIWDAQMREDFKAGWKTIRHLRASFPVR